VIGLGWCGLCGTTLDDVGARRCGCGSLSELAIITTRVAVLAARSSGFDPKSIKRALRLIAAERREERGLPRRRRAS
jgi:hypothetical protein